MAAVNNLPKLHPDPSVKVVIQETASTLDALGRYICNTWSEAVNNGGSPFDAVVIGSGMYGAYCAEQIYRLGAPKGLRVLVLEAGPFLVSEHIQNLARIGLNVPSDAIDTFQEGGKPRELVWGIAWRSNEPFIGQAYCIGGKSLYWGGWCPRLTTEDVATWPKEARDYLDLHYANLEEQTGAAETTDFIQGTLYEALKAKVDAVVGAVANLQGPGQAPPLAVQGQPPASGLFSFDKFSSAPLLIDAIREDAGAAGLDDSKRRLFLVPRAHVVKLHTQDGAVTGIEVAVDGQRPILTVTPQCAVILALGAIESTRLALESFPRSADPQQELMGRNLMVHMRSNLFVRIKREVLESPTTPLPEALQAAALLVRGGTAQGRFHLQLTASADPGGNSDALLFRMIPDIDQIEELLATQRAGWIALGIRGLAEMAPRKDAPLYTPGTSWIDLSPNQFDEFGKRRAFVHLDTTFDDDRLWDAMDAAAFALAMKLANDDPANIQVGSSYRDGLGTTYHEAGTLWMGDHMDSSVTDADGRFHHVQNAYCVDQARFPTIGSANPVLTGLVLARMTAQRVVDVAS
jgi:choline dehydrogenase-like flavoprotein